MLQQDRDRIEQEELEMQSLEKAGVKTAARETIDLMPENATWDDLIYRLYVRQKIEAGLADAQAGNLFSTEEARRRLGLGNED